MTRGHIAVLLCLMAVLGIGVEGATRFGYGRVSRIRHRTEAEYANARQTAGPRTLLVVGNSLLREGIDMNVLQRQLLPETRAYRFVVESTTYLDWYYGIRHLFSHGSRPEVVALVLSPRQWIAAGLHGESVAGLIIDRADLPCAAAETKADNTVASNLLFASCSSFYANRADIRKWLMGLVIPRLDALSTRLAPPKPPLPSDEELCREATSRLRRMNELCARHGARLLVVIPPTNQSHDGASGIIEAGREVGVEVVMPVDEASFAADEYSDGFHLNAHGRMIFTAAFAARLKELLRPAFRASIATPGGSASMSGNAAINDSLAGSVVSPRQPR